MSTDTEVQLFLYANVQKDGRKDTEDIWIHYIYLDFLLSEKNTTFV